MFFQHNAGHFHMVKNNLVAAIMVVMVAVVVVMMMMTAVERTQTMKNKNI
jgi:hypothetical protein